MSEAGKNIRGERVLVDADDFHAALAGIRGLRRAGFRPWVLTPARGTYAGFSRAAEGRIQVPDPREDAEAFVTAAARAAERVRAPLVLPGTEASLAALAGRDGEFPPSTRIGAPPPDVVARATDKDVLATLATEAGLATPPTLVLGREEVAEAEFAYPVVVKPVRTKTRGSSGSLHHGRVQLVSKPADLGLAAARLPGDRLVVQPYFAGTLAAVGGVAWHGDLVCAVHQRAVRISPPLAGGSSLAETVARDEELEAGVGRLLALLGWSGIFQVQLIHSGGEYYVIDLNPRMYGTLALALAAGANLPAIWASLVLGREPQIADYRVGVRYRAEEKELRTLVRAVLQRDLAVAFDCLRPRRHTTHAVFALRDPFPLAATFRRLVSAVRR
jgi:biotin carboxylase